MFTGFISSEDKLRALVDADVFVTPSFYGFPVTFLEACAVGTPIVTTSLGDTLEWIGGNVGYVTQPTPNGLAEAIYGIISDDELHRRFSKNCIEIVKSEFAIEKVVERLEEVYEEVVSARAKVDCDENPDR
jgi:glycosyltransferase involved in cell wall biosynthesis